MNVDKLFQVAVHCNYNKHMKRPHHYMIIKTKDALKKHKYKIVFGAPVLIVFFMGASVFDQSKNTLSIESQEQATHIFATGEEFTVSVKVSIGPQTPINVVSGSITFPKGQADVVDISTENSVIDLWAHDPSYSNELGLIEFAGGIVNNTGFTGTGNIFDITFRVTKKGAGKITFATGMTLAHDGKGTDVLTNTEDFSYSVQPPNDAVNSNTIKTADSEPVGFVYDLNKDGQITFSDISILVIETLKTYNAQYDYNTDGKVSFDDIKILYGKIGSML